MNRVVVTGLGVVTSIGVGKDAFWGSLINGVSGISDVSFFDTSSHFTHRGGEIKSFSPEQYIDKERIPVMSRATQFAYVAARQAIDDSGIKANGSNKYAVCVGTTMGSLQKIEDINERIIKKEIIELESIRQVPTNTTSSLISKEFGFKGESMMFSTACAAGNYALGHGFDLIRFGTSDLVLVGGTDAFSRVAFTGFNQFSAVAPEKCQPFDKNRKGMMVAEGAGMLILESLEHAMGRGAHIYAEISGYGLSCDASHMTMPDVKGVTSCMLKAIDDAGITTDDIDYISAHGTGTIGNDKVESISIKNIFGSRYKEVPVSSIKSMIGHSMGAASSIEAISCALTVSNDLIPPTINYETPDPECDIDCVPNKAREKVVNYALNNSYAFGGNNACVVIKKFNGSQ